MPAINPANDRGSYVRTQDEEETPTRTVNPAQDRPEQNDRNYVTVEREGGYTPSPVSPYITPNPVTKTPESVVQRMLDVQYYAPNLADKPGMAAAIALDPHVSKAEMRAIAGMELAVSRRLHLESLDTQMQIDVWHGLDAKTQRSLLAVGFVPGAVGEAPSMQQEDGGLWGWLKPVTTFWTPKPLEDDVLGMMEGVGDVAGSVGDGLSWAGDKIGAGSQWVEGTPVAAGISDSAAGDIIAGAGSALKNAGQGVVEAGMWALETPQELVFQDLRAFRILQDRDDLSFSSFNDIAEAFSIAEDGNRSFDTEYLSEAQARIGNDELYSLAVEVNSLPEEERAEWLARTVESAGGAEQDQAAMIDMYTKLQSSEFANAMDLVDAAHISVGRMIAQDYGIANMGDSDFDMISGALDFTARITLDPWLLAGGASKAGKAARYGINLGRKVEDAGAFSTRVDEIFRVKSTRRFWEGTDNNGALKWINVIRNTDDPAQVADAARRLKRYNGLDDTMTQAMLRADKEAFPLRDADDVANFVKSEHGKAAVFTGKAAFRVTALQKKNMLEHLIAQVKPGKVADWLDMKAGLSIANVGKTRGEMGLTDDMVEGGAKVTKVVEDPDLVGAAAKATGSVINQAWKKSFWYRANVMLTRLTTKVPVPREGKLFLDDAASVQNIHNMARTFGPRAWADQVTAAFTVANDVGRREIYKGMMETLGEAGGITHYGPGKQAWSEWVSRSVDDAYSSATGLDDIGNGQKAALYAHQLRNHVDMPDWALMHSQANRIGVLGKMGGHFTREGYDWFVQRAFKPSVLLRPALVLRNAGEEVLRHVVDNGPKSYLVGRAVRTHLRSGKARANGFIDPNLNDEWRFFRLLTKPAWKTYESVMNAVPGGARGTATRMQARNVRDWFTGGIIADMRRGALNRVIGKDTLEVLEELWDTSPRFRRLYAKDIMEQSRAAFVGLDSSPKAAAGLAAGRLGRNAAGRAGRIEWRETGEFSQKAVESHEGAARWVMRLDKLASDDFGAIAFQHLDNKALALQLLKEELDGNPLAKKALMGARKGTDEWASRIYEDVRFHFVGQNGRFQQSLFDKLVPVGDDGVRRIDYEAFDIDAVDELVPSVDDRPIHVLGREFKHMEKNSASLISRIIDGGFDYIGESTNHISRGPLFFANMVDAVKDTRPLYQAAQEAGIPVKVIRQEQKAFARKVVTGEDGEPITFMHGAPVKYDRLSGEFATKDNGAYHVGVEFTTDEGIAKRFAGPDPSMAKAFDPMLDDAADLQVTGKVHTVWVKKGKTLDVNESLDLDTYEDLLRTFAKKADLDDNFVNGQLFHAAQNGSGRVNDFYMAAERQMRRPTYYHRTSHRFEPGDKVIPSSKQSDYIDPDTGLPHHLYPQQEQWRADRVWAWQGDARNSYDNELGGLYEYEVDLSDAKALDRPTEYDVGLSAQMHGAEGTVVRRLEPGQKAAGVTDFRRLNEAFDGMLKAKKYKGFEREHGGHKITHVTDDTYILPNKYPTAGGAVTKKWAKQQQIKVAEQRAVERTLRFVDNPVQRSQFSVIARNLFPFWRAQEEFYRRWANTFKHSPESFRKAQLMMMGFEHSGFVQKDDAGHSYFVYPYIGEATEAFRKFGERIGVDFGGIPQVTQYSGQIRFMNQGIDPNNIQPAVSPILAFPIGLITNLWPEFQAVENVAVGEQGANRNIYLQLLPTPVRRLIEAGVGQDEWTSQMTSAAMNSVAALEAAGLTPPDNATADEIDAYLERVRKYTTFTLSMRAVWGAIAPTPLDQLDKSTPLPDHLQFDGVRTFDQQFMNMVEEMGYEKAITFWASANPDQVPFTVSKTESVSGAYWNSTEAAGEFYQQNKPLFDEHPRAATFLFPLDPTGEWAPEVFAVEMANNLRGMKDMVTFYKDMKLSGKLTEYYDSKENVEVAVADAISQGNYGLASTYQSSYDDWADDYKAKNPLLEEYINAGASRAYERKTLIEDMRSLLAEPNAPQSKATGVISDMIESYDNYSQFMTQNAGSTSAAELTRKVATGSFNDYMAELAKTDDNAWLFYNRTFRYMEN